MPDLRIKKLPKGLYLLLEQRAELRRRSLRREVILCLEQATSVPTLDPEAWLADVDRLTRRLRLTPVTERTLAREKARGRP